MRPDWLRFGAGGCWAVGWAVGALLVVGLLGWLTVCLLQPADAGLLAGEDWVGVGQLSPSWVLGCWVGWLLAGCWIGWAGWAVAFGTESIGQSAFKSKCARLLGGWRSQSKLNL